MAGQGRSGMPLWVGAGLLLALGLRLAVSQGWGPFARPEPAAAATPATALKADPTPGRAVPPLNVHVGPPLTIAERMKIAQDAQNEGQPTSPVVPPPPSQLYGLPKVMRISIEDGGIKLADGRQLVSLTKWDHVTKLFGPLRDHVNAVVPLDKDLVLHFKKCGEVNAFYSPVTDDLTVCTELIDTFELAFKSLPPDKAEAAVQGAALFSTAHELGHALIARLKLPAVGGEEQAADQFALLLLQQHSAEGTNQAINAAVWMSWMAAHRDPKQPLLFWDEHKLDAQRFFDMLCLAYGSDPFGHVAIVSEGFLPAPRAARCGDEYQKMKAAWKALLDPKLRKPL